MAEKIDALAKDIEEYKIIQSIPGIGEELQNAALVDSATPYTSLLSVDSDK